MLVGKRTVTRLAVARAVALARRTEFVRSGAAAAPMEGDLICGCGAVIVLAQRRRVFSEMTLCCARCGSASRVTAS